MSTGGAVLVTGGAGYIGSHVVWSLLDRGRQVVVADNLSTGVREAVPAGVPFHHIDLADHAALARLFQAEPIDAVMHFAGSIIVPESVADPLKYYANNTANALGLIRQCLDRAVDRFIFSSTAAVYGDWSADTVSEAAPTVPVSPYGWSKLMTEQMLLDASAAHPRFRPIRLRYFNVAGADPEGRAGQRGPQSTHLIRVAVETALGQRPHLEVFGDDYATRDGACERDYIHVSDLADAHVAALEHLEAGGEGGVFNCGYGRGSTVFEVIDALETVTGRRLPVIRGPRRPGDPPRLIADSSRLRGQLGWAPKHDDLKVILRTALAWQTGLPQRRFA